MELLEHSTKDMYHCRCSHLNINLYNLSIMARKRHNKVVKVLAQLYNRRYEDVLKLYNTMNGNIEHTKQILNLNK